MSRRRSLVTMESLEEVAAREEAERQQSLRDLEQLYEWLQQFEDPPPAPRPPPPYQFRNGMSIYYMLLWKYLRADNWAQRYLDCSLMSHVYTVD
nr:unnamed protein product [Callosobruchus analis]